MQDYTALYNTHIKHQSKSLFLKIGMKNQSSNEMGEQVEKKKDL